MVVMYTTVGLLLIFSDTTSIPQPQLIGGVIIIYGVMRAINLYLKRKNENTVDDDN